MLAYASPIAFASAVAGRGGDFVLLHSSLTGPAARQSLLAYEPVEAIKAADFTALADRLSHDQDTYGNAWFGYLGYGLKNAVECLAEDAPAPWLAPLPNLWMTRFAGVLQFDHAARTVQLHGQPSWIPTPETRPGHALPRARLSGEDMEQVAYLARVREVLALINAGDIYQANLTRKLWGEWTHTPDPIDFFARLCEVSPAPYSALLRLGEHWLASSSPELFLDIRPDGCVTTRPIKGSAGLEVSAEALHASAKDRAENLMITDLMRNDLGRACVPGTVRVPGLYEIDTYATLRHLSSRIVGIKRPECTALDVVRGCFPPGSMTGAPKIRAMEICSHLEPYARGVYSGAIGWFGGDGSTTLSVVIRTLIARGTRFEFQVGGGIVADSAPEAEWAETCLKARGLERALGLGD